MPRKKKCEEIEQAKSESTKSIDADMPDCAPRAVEPAESDVKEAPKPEPKPKKVFPHW